MVNDLSNMFLVFFDHHRTARPVRINGNVPRLAFFSALNLRIKNIITYRAENEMKSLTF